MLGLKLNHVSKRGHLSFLVIDVKLYIDKYNGVNP